MKSDGIKRYGKQYQCNHHHHRFLFDEKNALCVFFCFVFDQVTIVIPFELEWSTDFVISQFLTENHSFSHQAQRQCKNQYFHLKIKNSNEVENPARKHYNCLWKCDDPNEMENRGKEFEDNDDKDADDKDNDDDDGDNWVKENATKSRVDKNLVSK